MVNITCVECGHVFELPESKIPSSTFNVKCPACRKVFQSTVPKDSVNLKMTEKVSADVNLQNVTWDQFRPEVEGLIQAQLDTIRKDILLSVASLVGTPSHKEQVPSASYSEKCALVCESDAATAQQLVLALQRMGYSVQICSIASEALVRLESGFYNVITTDLVFSDDAEGGQKILNKVNARKPDERRKTFLVVVSDLMKTVGPRAAFFQGANIFVKKSDLPNLENLIQDGMLYFTEMYSNYYGLLEDSSERL